MHYSHQKGECKGRRLHVSVGKRWFPTGVTFKLRSKEALQASGAVRNLDSTQRVKGSYWRDSCRSRGLTCACRTLWVGLNEAGTTWKKEFRLLLNLESKQSMIIIPNKGASRLKFNCEQEIKYTLCSFLSFNNIHFNSAHRAKDFWRFHTLVAEKNCILGTWNRKF